MSDHDLSALLPHLDDAARDLHQHLAKETIKWLEESGFAKHSHQAVVILMQATQIYLGSNLVAMRVLSPEGAREYRQHLIQLLSEWK